MEHTSLGHYESRSLLGNLRRLVPERRVQFSEALRLAELQATKLRDLLDIETERLPGEAVSELPRISVQYRDIPTSGMSYWNGSCWIIAVNRWEPSTRQRFTLLHEFKHIVDHSHRGLLYRDDEQAEQAADYFAGCALMPRIALKRAWGSGLQRPAILGRLFDVSPRAVTVRLAQVGLTDTDQRCPRSSSTPGRRPGTYHRALSPNRPTVSGELLCLTT